ncbi:MAG: trigger factor [candidate division WOR-3 bacterium]|nr:MAG: trigger factor [candidate division WOR-3 bacterium]
MDYQVTSDGQTVKEISVTVPRQELDTFIDREVDKVRSTIALNGFRKGKVPVAIIKTKYRDTLKAQAMKSLINDAFITVVTEKKWQALSQTEVLNISEDDPITFQLRFEVVPVFDVENYLNIEVFEEDKLPDEYLLERVMKEIREQNATVKEVSRSAAVDDFVTVDLVLHEQEKQPQIQKNMTIRVGDRTWPDEINRALVGVNKSQRKEVPVEKQRYVFDVKKIEEKILPELDDAFAEAKGFKTSEELKKKLLEDAQKIEENRIKDELKESISHVLLERNRFAVPEALIKDEYTRMLQRFNLQDSEAHKERFHGVAEKRVRLNLILDKIAVKENISVDKNESQQIIKAMGIKAGSESYENVIEHVSTMLRRERTIDFLFEHAKISKKSRIISPKEVKDDTRTVRH